MTKCETNYNNSRKNYSIKCATCNSISREISVLDECIGTQDQNQTSKHCIARLSSTGWNTRSKSCKISEGHIFISQLHFPTNKHLNTRRNKIEKLIQNSNSSLFKIQTKISNSTPQSHHTFKQDCVSDHIILIHLILIDVMPKCPWFQSHAKYQMLHFHKSSVSSLSDTSQLIPERTI